LNLYEDDINQKNKLGSGGKIAFIYRKLLEDLWKGDENAINPSYFKNIFAQFVKKFSGYAQQDSNEFLIYLLDKIHEDLNSISKKPYIEIEEKGKDESDEDASKRWWEMHLLRENSIIVDLFQGQFKSTITCNYCNRIAVSFDSYMFLSLPIPSGKYEINIKYLGYEINNCFNFKIPITENTTVLNIIDIIEKKFSNKKSTDKAISNPPSKNNRRKNKRKKKFYIQKTEEILSGDYSVEIVLLTKYKNIYKVFNCNDYIFPYLQQGYELVAYEKKKRSENIYFYLTQYNNSYFSSYLYPKSFLFDYPLVIDVEKKEKIYSLYGKISIFLNKLISNNKKSVEAIDINSKFSQINKDNEKENGFTIYIDIYLSNKNNSFCESIFFSKYKNYLLLDKHSSSENINNIKKELNLNDNERLSLDINILFNLDKNKLPKFNSNSEKISLNSGKEINLYDCFNLFNSEEILDGDNEWYCNICKKHRDVNKKMDIFKSPYYLIIQLKRFKQDDEMGPRSIFNIFNSSKNTTFVDFPINDLDLSKYILSQSQSINGSKYDLNGVINHYGGSSFGHYTAYCLNGNKWIEYNDESLSKISKNNVVSNAAYVLFYKRNNN
jgi:ubiquitin carboxyl-terminal hydrolase 4/11/15